MKRTVLSILGIMLAVGCASNSASNAESSPSANPSASSMAATMAASATATIAASAAATVAATTDPLAGVEYTDVTGNFAETAIKELAALGVFTPKTGAFHPDAPVTRGQYIAWLVAANNIYFKNQPQGAIRPASPNVDQTFVDVPKSHPFFAQIEGMADAGFVIGIDRNHFAPDRLLTREELIAIQTTRYRGGVAFAKMNSASAMYCVHLLDANNVSKPYWGAFNEDQCTGFNGQDEIHRIFGAGRTLHPQRQVTRAEVAIALEKIAGHTAEQALH